jgi:hypothetical protein
MHAKPASPVDTRQAHAPRGGSVGRILVPGAGPDSPQRQSGSFHAGAQFNARHSEGPQSSTNRKPGTRMRRARGSATSFAHRPSPLGSGVLSGNDGPGRAQRALPCSRSNCGFSLAKARSNHPERLPRVRREGRSVNGENEAKKPEFLLSRFHCIARKPHEHRPSA